MPDIIYKYRLDLTGNHPDNRKSESRTIGTTVQRMFVPEGGPFYGNSIVLTERVSGRQLMPSVDYKLLHAYREAQEASAQPVYSVIYIHNTNVDPDIDYSLSYIGGEFSFTKYALMEILDTLSQDDRVVEWGQLLGIPDGFAPSRHVHTAYDLIGQKHLVAANNEIAKAIREGQIVGQNMLFSMIDSRLDLIRSLPSRLSSAFARGTAQIEQLIF